MSKKRKPIQSTSWARSFTASIAGARAGSALVVDSAFKKVFHRDSDPSSDSGFAQREARRFVKELGKLKGSYVKIGQMMALFGEHFLPAALTRALHELSDSTEALDWQFIEPVLKTNLAEKFDDLLIEKQPFAAASLSQAHRATILSSGETICLKVQYPGLAEVIDADFDTVVRMLLIARWLKAGKELDEWLATMRQQLHHEINYQREAQLTQQAAAYLAAKPYQSINPNNTIAIHVPKLYPQYCNEQLLALEFIDGLSVTADEVKQLPLARRNAIAKTMLELFFREVFEWGLLQTDPNFGNYLLCLEDRRKREANDVLVLLDYGAAIQLPPATLQDLQQVIVAGLQQDTDALVDGLLGLGWLKPDASEHARQTFAAFCINLLEPLRPASQLPAEYLNKSGEYCWSQSHLIQRAGKQGAANANSRHFSPPAREFILIARKLTGVFTFISVLNAEFNAYPIAQSFIDNWQAKTK